MGIVIHNYLFPIRFSYKGWYVEMDEVKGFFQLKDLKVRVEIKPSLGEYVSSLAQLFAYGKISQEIKKAKAEGRIRYAISRNYENVLNTEEYKEALAYYSKLYSEYSHLKKRTYTLSINGGLFDRLLGQNISATEKAKKQILEYIDNHLGDPEEDFTNYLKSRK